MIITDGQQERLACLTEELGEALQMVGKTLRHGFNSSHPDYEGRTNRKNLEKELGDVLAVILMLCEADDIVMDNINLAAKAKLMKVTRFLHQQENVHLAHKTLQEFTY
jgi:NTP pyrophosphatase (non-canonical NTP hydrolase)